MKKIILLPAFVFCLVSGLWAADDCSKSADACKPQIKKLTPFMAALEKAQKAPDLKQGTTREIALRPGEPEARPAASAASPLAEIAKDGPSGPSPAEAPAEKRTLSQPAWLLLVAALLAGLYYFLKEGKKKRKRV